MSILSSCCSPLLLSRPFPSLLRRNTGTPFSSLSAHEELATLMSSTEVPSPPTPDAQIPTANNNDAVQVFFDDGFLHVIVTDGPSSMATAGIKRVASIPHDRVFQVTTGWNEDDVDDEEDDGKDGVNGHNNDSVVPDAGLAPQTLRVVYDRRCLSSSKNRLLLRASASCARSKTSKSAVNQEEIAIPYPLAVFTIPLCADNTRKRVSQWFNAARRLAYPAGSLLRKRALVLINPRSGQSRGLRLWTRSALPVFHHSHVRVVDTIVTTYAGHAEEIARQIDPRKIDLVVVCSGDGLICEVINGLANNEVLGVGAAGAALARVSVAHVPCGSGNAFARNWYGTTDAKEVAMDIVKGTIGVPMDLMSITKQTTTPPRSSDGLAAGDADVAGSSSTPERSFAFLSIALGLIARADIDTEWARSFGNVRFAAGVLGYSFSRYPARVWIKPVVEGRDGLTKHYENEQKLSDRKRKREEVVHHTNNDDDDVVLAGEQVTSSSPSSSTATSNNKLPPLQHGTADDPLDAHGPWYELDDPDRLLTLYCGNLPWVSTSDHIFPLSLPSDGLLDLIWLQKPTLSSLSSSPSSSAHAHRYPFPIPSIMTVGPRLIRAAEGVVDLGATHYCKIAAMRIIPSPKTGAVAVDGERWDLDWAVQVEVHKGLGRVVAGRGQVWGAVGGGGTDLGTSSSSSVGFAKRGVKKWVGKEYVPSTALKMVGKKRETGDGEEGRQMQEASVNKDR